MRKFFKNCHKDLGNFFPMEKLRSMKSYIGSEGGKRGVRHKCFTCMKARSCN